MADEFIVRLAQRRDAADGTPLDDESPLAPVVPERRSAMSPWELLERWHREDGLLDDLEEETLARPSFSLSRWHHAPHGAPVFPLEWAAEAWRRFDPIIVAHRARAPDLDVRDPDVFRAPRPAAFPDPASWDTTRAVAVGAVVVALRRRVLSLSTAPELLDDVLANDRWFRRHRADPAEATGAALLFAAFQRAADRLRTEVTSERASAASRAESAAERTRTATRDDAVIDWGVATAAMRAVGRARTMARALARIAAQPPAEPVGDAATAAAARVAARSARDAALALGARLDEMAAAGGAIRREGGEVGEVGEVVGGRGGRRNGRAPEAAARPARVASSSATTKRRVVATPGATPGAKAASLALASPPRRRALGDATNRVAVFSPGSPVVLSPRRAGAFAGGDRAGR